jgi:aspartyl aminopeptidase
MGIVSNNITDLLDFIDASPSPYHCVKSVEDRLKFKLLSEQIKWTKKEVSSKNIVIRNKSSFVAFKLPKTLKKGGLSFRIIASHTDSPCLKLKVNGSSVSHQYHQWGTEIYGGVLLNSWLDRDLYVSGILSYINSKGKIIQELIKLDDYLFRVPQLAIHLDRDISTKGLQLNKQKHMQPLIGLEKNKNFLNLLMEKLPNKGRGIKKETLFFDLVLADRTPSKFGGIENEFIYAPRLDNQAMCHASIVALQNYNCSEDNIIPVVCSFDHEEVGSSSLAGAQSDFLHSVLTRLASVLKVEDDLPEMISRSYMISADMAHAVHPNYAEKHDPQHLPVIGSGPVIKTNSNMRYASNPETNTMFASLCLKSKINFQNFVSRSDIGCGSTIGPLASTKLGIKTIDVGNPMLSMHSAREMGGSEDHDSIIKVFKNFLAHAE